MKRRLYMKNRLFSALALAVAFLGATPLWAQAAADASESAASGTARLKDDYGMAEARRDFRQLALSDAEVASVQRFIERDARELELARASIREQQAKLARLMLEKKPDLPGIEKTVRLSLEEEYKVRMVQIRRNMALRELLGDKRWAALSRLARATAFLARRGDLKDLSERAGDAEKLVLLFEILKSLQ